jgi:hypothetical protein
VYLPLQLMETQLDDWMAEFHTYLTMSDIPALTESDPSKESITDAVRSAVCANINLVRCNNSPWVQGTGTGWCVMSHVIRSIGCRSCRVGWCSMAAGGEQATVAPVCRGAG